MLGGCLFARHKDLGACRDSRTGLDLDGASGVAFILHGFKDIPAVLAVPLVIGCVYPAQLTGLPTLVADQTLGLIL